MTKLFQVLVLPGLLVSTALAEEAAPTKKEIRQAKKAERKAAKLAKKKGEELEEIETVSTEEEPEESLEPAAMPCGW